VLLLAQASFHLDELIPLRTALLARGVPATVAIPLPDPKPLNRFRPGVRRYVQTLAAADEPLGTVVSSTAMTEQARALVVMNDWGPTRSLVEAVKASGRPTFGWVEGVQDFDDVDTGRERRAYRTVDHVFCLGRHDQQILSGVTSTIVGSTRLRSLWEAPAIPESDSVHVTINPNFTYGVFTRARRGWVRSAVSACRRAEVDWELSRHVAERGCAFPHRASRTPSDELLARSTHLISRFSTLGYEALVRGVQLLYHNPHGEKVATFEPITGAVAVTRSQAELVACLEAGLVGGDVVRQKARAFLETHLNLAADLAPAEIAADVISSAVDDQTG
jgi:hypothetical protein